MRVWKAPFCASAGFRPKCCYNPKALVEHHDATTREVRFNGRLHAFARYWGFAPRACAPYRARTKGKDERGVGYVKKNAIAGRRFESWAALEAHLDRWMREVADQRVHGTTGVAPAERFAQWTCFESWRASMNQEELHAQTRFTKEFQDEAVRLGLTSGRSRREIAADLGVGLSTLRHWIDRRRSARSTIRPKSARRTWRPS